MIKNDIKLRTVFFNMSKIYVNFSKNLGLDKKIMTLVIENEETGLRIVLPITEDGLQFLKSSVGKFDEWVNKDKEPKMNENYVKDNETQLRYIG